MCRYPNMPRPARPAYAPATEQLVQEVPNSIDSSPSSSVELVNMDVWGTEDLFSGLVKPESGEGDEVIDWISEPLQTEVLVESTANAYSMTPGYFDLPLQSPSANMVTPGYSAAPMMTPSTEVLLLNTVSLPTAASLTVDQLPMNKIMEAVPETIPTSQDIKLQAVTKSDEASPSPARFPARVKQLVPMCPKRGAAPRVIPPVTAKKQRRADAEEDPYANIKAKMPVIDYATMSTDEIQVAKRERNRLAAEKYRRKGRDLVERLQSQNDDLLQENEELRQCLQNMSAEMQALRDLVHRSTQINNNAQYTMPA